MIVPAPEGRGAWIAHAPDRQLYRYTEGLMAASGSLGNDRRQPRGLVVLDDNLREREDGRFEAFTQPPHGGPYDVVVALGQPAMAACFTVQVAGPSAEQVAQAGVKLVGRVVGAVRERDGALRIDVALAAAADAPLPPLADLELMAFDARTQWQQRTWLRETAPGRYTARLGGLPAARAPSDLVWLAGSRTLDAPLAAHRLAFDASISCRRGAAVMTVQRRAALLALLPLGARAQAQWTPPKVPDVALQDQDGRAWRLAGELAAARPIVVSFMFTSCAAACPPQTAALRELRRALDAEPRRARCCCCRSPSIR